MLRITGRAGARSPVIEIMFFGKYFELNSKYPDNCIRQQSTIDQYDSYGISSVISFGLGTVSRTARVSSP